MIWSTLHSALQVWVLAGLLSVFITSLMLWMRVRRKMRDYFSRSRQIALASEERRNFGPIPMIDWTVRRWPVILIALTGLSLAGNAFLVWRDWHPNPASPVFEYHDVRFLKQLDSNGYSWAMEKADGPFRADFCHDYDVSSLNAQPGEVLRKLRYKDLGCWSIKDQDLGFWFYRDKNTSWTIPTDIHTEFKTALKEIKAHE